MLEEDGVLVLAARGVLSADELLGVVILLLPLASGVEDFLGEEEPKPTGVALSTDARPAPDLMLEDLLTEEDPPLGLSSELRETWEPVREGGLEPFLEEGAWDDRRKDMVSSP
jgi:hypothetical protein